MHAHVQHGENGTVGSSTGRLSFRHRWVRLDLLVLAVTGEIDLVTTQALATELNRKSVRNTVVDLSSVGFLSVSGARALAETASHARSEGRTFVLAACSSAVHLLLTAGGSLTASLRVADNVEDAVRSLSPPTSPLQVTASKL